MGDSHNNFDIIEPVDSAASDVSLPANVLTVMDNGNDAIGLCMMKHNTLPIGFSIKTVLFRFHENQGLQPCQTKIVVKCMV